METMHEFVPFVKEMLSAGPSKRAMKVYLVGGTFAVLGIVSGMMEVACSLFPDQEEPVLEKLMEEKVTVTEQAQEAQTAIQDPDDMDAETEAKAKEHPMLRQRRMSFRAHAS